MRNTFGPLDDALIERLFQPTLDWILFRTGVSRAAIACLCLDLASLSWITSRASALASTMAIPHPGAAFAGLAFAGLSFPGFAFLLLGLVALISLRTLLYRSSGRQGNPLRVAMQPHRAILLLMLAAHLLQPTIPALADVADVAMLLFAVSALYLGACLERPPIRRSWNTLLRKG